MTGPFQTEREAREAARDWPGTCPDLSSSNLSMLLDVVLAAGIETGSYDRRIVEWLAGYEPATCAVIAGLITRAGQAQGGAASERG